MGSILAYWHFDIGLILLFVLFSLIYGYLSGFKLLKGSGCYFGGLLLMLLIEVSPLHFLGMHYLMSAFMVVHIILLLICGPMLLLGIPRGSDHRFIWQVSRFFNYWPWMGWLSAIGLMWFWHIPAVFDAVFPADHSMFRLHWISFFHSGSLLLAGMFFSWPIVGPVKELQINPLLGIVYLFTACIGCSILGLLLTFAPPALYHHYFLSDEYGFAEMINNQWGISRAKDQQVAGLLMWVPCCFIYLSGSMVLFYRLLHDKGDYAWKK